MVLWVLDEGGRSHKLFAEYAPPFYLDEAPDELLRFLGRTRVPIEIKKVLRKELSKDDEVRVVEVAVRNPLAYTDVVTSLQRRFPERTFFTCDVDLELLYFYETGLFPLAQVELEIDRGGKLLGWEVKDNPRKYDYAFPSLNVMELSTAHTITHPKQTPNSSGLCVRLEGQEYEITSGFEVRELTRLINRYDPHLILTEWGDDYLIAALSKLRGFRTVPFHRDGMTVRRRGRPRSYFTYGQIKYSAPSYFFGDAGI